MESWAFGICAAAAVGSVIRLLLPGVQMQKIMSLAINVFFVSCLLFPWDFKGVTLPKAEILQGEQRIAQPTKEVLLQAQQYLALRIEEALDREQIPHGEIRADLHIDEDGRIECREIAVYGGDLSAKDWIEQTFGLPVQLKEEKQ